MLLNSVCKDFLNLLLDLNSGIQNSLSWRPNSLMSSRVSGILRSAVSGKKRPGMAPSKQRKPIIRNGAFSDITDWKSWSKLFSLNHSYNFYRVHDIGRRHLRDHGHDVDQGVALAPEAGRHHLNCELEAHIHRVGREETANKEQYYLSCLQFCKHTDFGEGKHISISLREWCHVRPCGGHQ